MSKFFSLSLYRQGLKKSRIVGIAITLIATIPTITGILSQLLTRGSVDTMDGILLTLIFSSLSSSSLQWVILLAPLLALNLFSFLNRRNESDFYHAIPFTRPCVYVSFLAAALTWITLAIALPVLLSSLFYAISPAYSIAFATPFRVFATHFVSALFLIALMAMAMTLTGTLLSNILVFLLLFTFPRIVGLLFEWYLDSSYGFPPMVLDLTPLRFLQFSQSLPLATLPLFGSFMNVSYDGSLLLYTAVVSLLFILIGCLFYTKRRSEIAGRSAPTPILQHIFRCAFVFPLVFITAIYVLRSTPSEVVTPLVVLVVITLLIYYLYEIITTKRLKNLWKATLLIPVLVAGGVLFGVSVKGTEYVASHYTPDADDLRSVSIYYVNNTASTYEERMAHSVACKDPEALEFVAAKLAEMRQVIKTQGVDGYQNLKYEDITLKITEKSGRVCGRTFTLSNDDFKKLFTLLGKSEECREALLPLPEENEIYSIRISNLEQEHAMVYWNSFVKEYNALSKEEKLQYKTGSFNQAHLFQFSIQGMINGSDYFVSTYPLQPEYFPETAKAFIGLMQRINKAPFDTTVQKIYDSPREYYHMIALTSDNLHHYVDEKGYTTIPMLEKVMDHLNSCKTPAEDEEFRLVCIRLSGSNPSAEQYYALSPADFHKLCEIMGYKTSFETP